MDEGEALCRIDELARRVERDRNSFEAPADPPARSQALEYLTEGAGQAVWLYVEARVDGFVHIAPDDFERLEAAMNEWFELYAACYGEDIDADVPIRTAAELLLETHDITDTAAMLTRVGVED